MTMHLEAGALNTLGFRHVVEDGLAILNGRHLELDRKHFVLSDLKNIISEAKRCSEVAKSQTWFFTNTNHEAHELFSLLTRYLDEQNKPWHDWLDATVIVLDKISKGDTDMNDSQTQATERFLKELLVCVSSLPRLPRVEGVDLQDPLARP